jgi:hypothetical protein
MEAALMIALALAAADQPLTASTASDACAHERAQLAQAKTRLSDEHPSITTAEARIEAACQPAPTADCARARAELAELKIRYPAHHPAVTVGRVRSEALCAAAPNEACARARADLAEAKIKLLDRHPTVVAARKASEQACGVESDAQNRADKREPRVKDSRQEADH